MTDNESDILEDIELVADDVIVQLSHLQGTDVALDLMADLVKLINQLKD